jgi:heme/copper-type cytochrome/quinol oxidase subunit 2
MRAKVVVESPAKFNEWVEGLDQETPKPLLEVVEETTVSDPPALDAGGA